MTTQTPEAYTQGLVTQIAQLDEKIEDLTDTRVDEADRLERAAYAYYEALPQNHRWALRALDCSHCHFIYLKATDKGLVFGSDCSWCGRSGDERLTVSLDDLAKHVVVPEVLKES